MVMYKVYYKSERPGLETIECNIRAFHTRKDYHDYCHLLNYGAIGNYFTVCNQDLNIHED